MINRDVQTTIDTESCIGCGLCVAVCPSETLSLIDIKAVVTGDRCLSCGHCEAVCPADAIHVALLAGGTPDFQCFDQSERWIPFGQYDIVELVSLMRSRRSCRNYRSRPVERELLEDLVNIGICAPSGTNSQKWTFTILPNRKSVMETGKRIKDFFEKLNRLSANIFLRKALKLIGRDELDVYYRDYYRSVKEAVSQYEKYGKDLLFHGATAAIVVGSGPDASCPAEDALLATQNMILAAHALGLGSCLIGFAAKAMQKDKSIARALGIPDDESVYSVIALGYPNETYQKPCGRKKPVIRFGA